MKKKVLSEISKLHAELSLNNGVIPESWKPCLTVIWLVLELAELFTNDAIDQVIEQIQTAILEFRKGN